MAKAFDIVVNPVGSLFAKRLQQAVSAVVINKVYRRATPKVVAAKRTIISRKGNVLRRGTSGYVRDHFCITPRVLNKVEQFERFVANNVSAPRHACSSADARNIECKTLFARTTITGTNGAGIVEFERSAAEYPNAPLYTEYIPKKSEYRFHVFGDKVIDVQQKKKKREFDADNRDTRIRNLSNGYVYTRDGVAPPDGAADLAVRAVAALGYQYGAVDLIYNEKRNQCYVLEVNSRPGLMGTTLEKYAEALVNLFNLEKKNV